MKRPLLIVALLLALVTAHASADVALPKVFGDHMVLQQNRPIVIWGFADAGEEVTVTIGDASAKATPDAAGRWQVELPALPATAPDAEGLTVTIAGKNTLTLTDVLVGEVWLCSGQSNMQWPVQRSANAEQETAAADHPRLRLLQVQQTATDEPQRDIRGGPWQVCTPQTVPGFSAVGYFFGRQLHRELGVPVGLINSSWGGTPAEAWTTAASMASHEATRPIIEAQERAVAAYPEAKAQFEADLAAWEQEQAKAKADAEAAGQPEPKPTRRKPQAPRGPDHPHRPQGIYNGMIAPLTPLPLAGVIWYQGESNASRAGQYRVLLGQLIGDWRSAFATPDLPFGIVQLANFKKRQEQPTDTEWAQLREAQYLVTTDLPGTGLAVAIDIGDADDIHPRNKRDVGERLSRWALNQVYGRNVLPSGPVAEAAAVEGNTVRVTFNYVGEGLASRQGPLTGFAIAGEDQKFVWADATIERNSVVVSSPQVPAPRFVRYAWGDNPECNLYNADGLPAVPFRIEAKAP